MANPFQGNPPHNPYANTKVVYGFGGIPAQCQQPANVYQHHTPAFQLSQTFQPPQTFQQGPTFQPTLSFPKYELPQTYQQGQPFQPGMTGPPRVSLLTEGLKWQQANQPEAYAKAQAFAQAAQAQTAAHNAAFAAANGRLTPIQGIHQANWCRQWPHPGWKQPYPK